MKTLGRCDKKQDPSGSWETQCRWLTGDFWPFAWLSVVEFNTWILVFLGHSIPIISNDSSLYLFFTWLLRMSLVLSMLKESYTRFFSVL